MSKTFTGLKLQGEIGKFGKSELTDIIGFVELPNGKVVSGTEFGYLLLWDENSIKREIFAKNLQTCHDGTIEVVLLEGNTIITAGVDGYVKLWSTEELESADISEEAMKPLELAPIDEIFVGNEVKV
jgi:hypothetical protein